MYDSSTDFAMEVRRPLDEMSENGRGLYIISKIARRMSIHPLDGVGKRVSVTLEFPFNAAVADVPRCGRQWLRHDSGLCLAPRIARYREAQGQIQA